MKKALFAVLGIFFLFVAAAIIVPLVVNVDQYRPKIVELANQNINGKLGIGKLTLSLWGKILIRVEGLTLDDAQSRKVVSVTDAYFHLPFFSIFSGSPVLTFNMVEPQVYVNKTKEGKLNVLSLVKSSKTQDAAPAPGAGDAPKATSGGSSNASVTLPALVTRARFGTEWKNAVISYKDQGTGLENQIKNLNLSIKDISMTRTSVIEIWADLETKMGKTISIVGPFKLKANLTPEFQGAEFKKVKADFMLDGDKLAIEVPGSFKKSSQVPLHLKAKLESSPTLAMIQEFQFVFHNLNLGVSGQVENTGSQAIDLNIKTNTVDLAPWVDVLPPLAGKKMTGNFTLTASAKGPATKLGYEALMGLNDIVLSGEGLKAEPKINCKVHVVTDQLKEFLMTMKAPGNDLKVTASVQSFAKPQFKLAMTSTGMDLNQMIEFPPIKEEPPETTASATTGGATGSGAKSAPAPDYDAQVVPLSKNAMLRGMKGSATVNLAFIKARDVTVKDIVSRFTFSDLVARLEEFRFEVFDGKISSNFSVNLGVQPPTYTLGAKVERLDIKKSVESQYQVFKNTLYGILDFNMNGSGKSFNPDPAKKNLNLSGSFRVTNAKFASLDVGKMAGDAINESIDKIASKVPKAGDKLKGKKIEKVPGRESKYEFIKTDFKMSGGVFSAPNFYAKAERNSGVDLDGRTQVNLISEDLDARWVVRDVYNTTKAADLSVDVGGKNVPHVLAEGNPPVVSFPVNVKCKMKTPCTEYGEVPEHLAKVASNNIERAFVGAAKEKAKEKAVEQIKKVVPEQHQEKVNKALKKFGF